MSQTQSRPEKPQSAEIPALWCVPAPAHFDTRVAWWIKAALVAGATGAAILWLDQPIAAWVLRTQPLAVKGDIERELMLLEQFGQWTCSVMVIAAVALIDRAGRRKALVIGLGCLLTVLLTYMLKDLLGRSRPGVIERDALPDLTKVLGYPFSGAWTWGGPAVGFHGGSRWTSFPSAHTTGAFALACGLAWFYPRGRGLFMLLATITAVQRVLHGAHYLSDTIAGMGLAVCTMRWTLQVKLAGRLIAVMPEPMRKWWLMDSEDKTASSTGD